MLPVSYQETVFVEVYNCCFNWKKKKKEEQLLALVSCQEEQITFSHSKSIPILSESFTA